MRVSACVIVKNEEENILRWIGQMKKLAFQLIVVDTGSTDQTVDLVRQAGIEPYFYQWKNEICCDNETLLIIKTKKELFSKVQSKILELHSYDVPEIIEIDISNFYCANYFHCCMTQSISIHKHCLYFVLLLLKHPSILVLAHSDQMYHCLQD